MVSMRSRRSEVCPPTRYLFPLRQSLETYPTRLPVEALHTSMGVQLRVIITMTVLPE